MAYRLLLNESTGSSLQRVVREQIAAAIQEVTDKRLERQKAVHQARKRCKRIRAALRLLREPLGTSYSFENGWFRDAARRLAPIRDAAVMVATYDALMGAFETHVHRPSFALIRRGLTARCQQVAQSETDPARRLKLFRNAMQEADARVALWPLSADGFAALEKGLTLTYERARRGLRRSEQEPSDENLHDWRKRVKYHRYHLRLLRDVWKPVLRVMHQEVVRLSDGLGDDHDLAVLRRTLLAHPEQFGRKRDLQAFVGLLDRRRAELQSQAWPLGKRLFAEKPKDLRRRLEGYWKVWKSESQRLSGLTQ